MDQGQIGVSIVLPTYNRAHTISASIESVLAQTYPYFELLIIDDGSTDDTEAVVKNFVDKRIVYYKLEKNSGQSHARNVGIQMAKYDYIAFEDSDDLWYPEKLEKQMNVILHANEKVGMVYHSLKYETEKYGTVIIPDEDVTIERKSGDIYAQLLWMNMIGMPTLLVKKECIEKVGGLDESFLCLEDYEWVLRLAQKYHAIFINEILLDAAYSNTGVSSNFDKYMHASLSLLYKYKNDYLKTNTLNHALEKILREAQKVNMQEQVVALLEKIMQS